MARPAKRVVSADAVPRRAGAGRGASQTEATLTDKEILTREAQRLAALAAEFALFGLRVDLPSDAHWADASDLAYRSAEPPQAAPANDTEPRPGFPRLTNRGLHLAPGAPAKAMQALDWVFVLVIAELAALWSEGVGIAGLSLGHAATFLLAASSLKAGLWLTESYKVPVARMRPGRTIGGLAIGAIAGLLFASFLAPDARSAAALATILPAGAMVIAGLHAAFAVWIGAAHKAGVFAETVVIVGATDAAQRLAARSARTGEARILAVVDDRVARSPITTAGAPVAGAISDLLSWEGLPHLDRVVIAISPAAETRVRDIIKSLRVIPNRVDLLLDYETQSVRGPCFERFLGGAVACVSGRPRNYRRAVVKRAQDMFVGAALLLAFAAPMLAIALAIKMDSKGPALFRQRRHGFNSATFTMLKFRTMIPAQAGAADAERVTRVGRFLRRTSLDELPQLFNVLHGEMSLVGPRPHEVGKTAAERPYDQIVAEYAHRHRVKPGITGWAQVNGCRGAVTSPAALRRRVKLDLDYAARACLWLDLQILARTVSIVLAGFRSVQ